MAAIITEKFRLNNAKSFVEEVGENEPYTFIGRGHAWTDDSNPPTPVDSPNDEFDAYRNMVALKQIGATDVTHAIVRRDWTSGVTYDEYRHNYSSGNTATSGATTLWDSLFYVVTDDYNVYKCISNGTADGSGANASTVKPTHTTLATPTSTADKYQWKYMYSITASDVIKFVTNDFIPVKTLGAQAAVDGSLATGGLNATADDDASAQWDVEDGAVDGAIDKVRIRDAGSGLTNGSYPNVVIYGDGSGGLIDVTVASNVVTAVGGAVMDTAGTGYTYAYVLASDVGGPAGQPADGTSTSPNLEFIIGPKHGHGADAVEELGGNYVILNSRLEYAEGAGDFPTDNDFRQIGVIFNPTNYNANTLFTGVTGRAYKTIEFIANAFAAPAVDTLIRSASTEAAGTAKGVVVSVDTSTRIISYLPYPNLAGNFVDFANSAQIYSATSTPHGTLVAASGGAGGSDAVVNEDIKRFSGDIIYLENRGAVSRASDQIEDIKLIVEM